MGFFLMASTSLRAQPIPGSAPAHPTPTPYWEALPEWENDVDPKYYTSQSIQPETPAQLLRRLEPRLERDLILERIYGEIEQCNVPEFDVHGVGLIAACKQINRLIRLYNARHYDAHSKAEPIPPLKFTRAVLEGFPASSVVSDPAGLVSSGTGSIVPASGLVLASGTGFIAPPASAINVTMVSGTGYITPPASAITVSLSVKNISLTELIRYVCALGNVRYHIEPDAIWIEENATGGPYLGVTHSYIIPKVIFKTRDQATAVLNSVLNAPEFTFDENNRLLKISASAPVVDEFEVWYAHELNKRGYYLPTE
jgi:hypothetical protein